MPGRLRSVRFDFSKCHILIKRGYVDEWKKQSERTQQIGALKLLYNRMTKDGNLDVDALNKSLDHFTKETELGVVDPPRGL